MLDHRNEVTPANEARTEHFKQLCSDLDPNDTPGRCQRILEHMAPIWFGEA